MLAGGGYGRDICIGPPAQSAMARQTNVAGEGEIDLAKVAAEASFDVAVIDSLGRLYEQNERTLFLQYSLYRLCEAYMNEMLDGGQLVDVYKRELETIKNEKKELERQKEVVCRNGAGGSEVKSDVNETALGDGIAEGGDSAEESGKDQVPGEKPTKAKGKEPTEAGGEEIADAGGEEIADAGGEEIADAGGEEIADAGGEEIADAGGEEIADAGGEESADAEGEGSVESEGKKTVSAECQQLNGQIEYLADRLKKVGDAMRAVPDDLPAPSSNGYWSGFELIMKTAENLAKIDAQKDAAKAELARAEADKAKQKAEAAKQAAEAAKAKAEAAQKELDELKSNALQNELERARCLGDDCKRTIEAKPDKDSDAEDSKDSDG